MKSLFAKTARFYFLCCIFFISIVWIDTGFVFDSLAMGFGLVLTPLFVAPAYTLVIVILHLLNLNRKILGNIWYELFVLLFVGTVGSCYESIAYALTDDVFCVNPDGSISKKWYLVDGTIDLVTYLLLLVLLIIHGKSNISFRRIIRNWFRRV